MQIICNEGLFFSQTQALLIVPHMFFFFTSNQLFFFHFLDPVSCGSHFLQRWRFQTPFKDVLSWAPLPAIASNISIQGPGLEPPKLDKEKKHKSKAKKKKS